MAALPVNHLSYEVFTSTLQEACDIVEDLLRALDALTRELKVAAQKNFWDNAHNRDLQQSTPTGRILTYAYDLSAILEIFTTSLALCGIDVSDVRNSMASFNEFINTNTQQDDQMAVLGYTHAQILEAQLQKLGIIHGLSRSLLLKSQMLLQQMLMHYVPSRHGLRFAEMVSCSWKNYDELQKLRLLAENGDEEAREEMVHTQRLLEKTWSSRGVQRWLTLTGKEGWSFENYIASDWETLLDVQEHLAETFAVRFSVAGRETVLKQPETQG